VGCHGRAPRPHRAGRRGCAPRRATPWTGEAGTGPSRVRRGGSSGRASAREREGGRAELRKEKGEAGERGKESSPHKEGARAAPGRGPSAGGWRRKMSCAREREIVREERERGLGGGAAVGRGPQGKGGGSSNCRAHSVRGGGEGGWAAEPAQEGERGGSRSWAASLARPRAWLGHTPGRAARRGGGERREKGFSLF
jgi:hypothetical protein